MNRIEFVDAVNEAFNLRFKTFDDAMDYYLSHRNEKCDIAQIFVVKEVIE